MKKIILIGVIFLLLSTIATIFSNSAYSENSQIKELLYKANILSPFKYQEKMNLYQKALELAKKEYKENHPQIGIILFKLARIYYNKNDFSKAEPLYRQVIEKEYEETNIDKPILYALQISKECAAYELAQICKKQGRESETETYLNKALILTRKDSSDKILFPGLLFNLADFYVKQDKPAVAENFLIEIQHIAESDYEKNKDDLLLILTYRHLLPIYKQMGNNEKIKEIKAAMEKATTGLNETEQNESSIPLLWHPDILKQFISRQPSLCIVSIIFMLILLICAIGIFLRRNWARKSLIIIMILSTLLTLKTLIFGPRILEKHIDILSSGERTVTVTRHSVILSIIFLIIYIVIIFFLTRPKVKEQFK